MKNLLKRLHIVPNQSEDPDGSKSVGNSTNSSNLSGKISPSRSSASPSSHLDQKPLSALSGWLNCVTGHSPPASLNPSPSLSSSSRGSRDPGDALATTLNALGIESDPVRGDSESSSVRDPFSEEEYQIQIALALSAKEDPEAVQIEAVKQISLGSCSTHNTAAEVLAYRYWNYNAVGYDDKILDGFYDLYGIVADSTLEKMPSLVDLQGTPVSDSISWEAVLVNRAADADLVRLEQKALVMTLELSSGSLGGVGRDVVQKFAVLVADSMGGSVGDPNSMLKAWRNLSESLRATAGNVVLPLGLLTIGLARHRALLFKVLADGVGIPCRLVKGQQYTGSDDVAMNIVKIEDGREYIVDLMADPGTLIPYDVSGTQMEYDESFFAVSPLLRDVNNSTEASSSTGVTNSIAEGSVYGIGDRNVTILEREMRDKGGSGEISTCESPQVRSPCKESSAPEISGRLNYPFTHARSPSWTEGVSSPAVHRMKVKDVSQYMIDAAKENPQLAQKLHDVLLESGVVAPPNLFTEIYTEQPSAQAIVDNRKEIDDKNEKKKRKNGTHLVPRADMGQLLPPLPNHSMSLKASRPRENLENLKLVEGLGDHHPLDLGETTLGFPCHFLQSEGLSLPAGPMQETSPPKYIKHVHVAAAAAATAAVVASSMVVAASKSITDSNLEVPVAAAAATATAAAVVGTTAVVSRRYEHLESFANFPSGALCFNHADFAVKKNEAEGTGKEPQGCGDRQDDGVLEREQDAGAMHQEVESSDKSVENDSVKSDVALDDVAEWEILWEEMTLGERIGLGSYGEVYRGDWHGTEVAVKKFLDQDISGDTLEEFRREVRIMKRLRHPNVVLFMGAVTRAPNLSIVTEFLPRGSLYRFIHRTNNQLDGRRRLRMALDVARGMNYLHNCTPIIVHRDLKSPNLLVDKNWVVKVCDFGLSRMKHNTFLSSRSTAGTAEWMAPEVLRNEPSDEKCDVYSFGVILWELATLQQPWGGMNPMQVVGAVGFQHRRLEIPGDMDPIVSDIIKKCWQTDPKLRPTFAEIMSALKPLQKPIVSMSAPRPRTQVSAAEKGPLPVQEDQTGQEQCAKQSAAALDQS